MAEATHSKRATLLCAKEANQICVVMACAPHEPIRLPAFNIHLERYVTTDDGIKGPGSSPLPTATHRIVPSGHRDLGTLSANAM